jgi:ubiquinone/menaquinone biosynthesis C-methylase UbiE
MDKIINKTMERSDLLTEEGQRVVKSINDLILNLYSKNLYMTSWYGELPRGAIKGKVEDIIRKILKKPRGGRVVGVSNRGPFYEALSDAVDDGRIPWYLYWEIFWVLKNGPQISRNMRLLDAGGTSSLFTCYLSALGCEVHSIDLNKKLIANGRKIAKAMDWNMFSYRMNMKKLDFEDNYFDHVYSICVFEHLDYEIKQLALKEIARCLKPNGILSISFDYRNPAPGIVGYGPDTGASNQIMTNEDIKRSFLSTGHFELIGNQILQDNRKSYLVHPGFNNAPYTFGCIFLRKKE